MALNTPPSTAPSMAPNNNDLPELPNEIWLLIVQNCPGATLKKLRLTSKSLAQMADPYLWRKVVWVPVDLCITGFMTTLHRSQACRHVTKLTYDGRFGSFFPQLEAYKSTKPLPATGGERLQSKSLLDHYARSRFKQGEDMGVEVAFLAKALLLLPNLRSIRVIDQERGGNPVPTKVPYFYHKVCKLVNVDPEEVNFSRMGGIAGRSFAKGVLTAAFSAGTHLQTLKTANMDARVLFGLSSTKPSTAHQQMVIFQTMMDDLRTLELSFKNDTLITSANHLLALQALLNAARKLSNLTLRLTDCSLTYFQYSEDDHASDLSGIMETRSGNWTVRPIVPLLDTLVIDGCICHDEELIHFLKIHSATLRHLELSNITLLGGEDRRECLVMLIKQLKQSLRLSSVSFSGWFTNGGRQQWFVAKDSVGEGRLKARVEKYIVDPRVRECPLEPIAIKPNQGDVDEPAAGGDEYEGDLTWTMIYSNRFHREHMDWELTEPSFGVPSTQGNSDPSSASDATPLSSPQQNDDWWDDLESSYEDGGMSSSASSDHDAKTVQPPHPVKFAHPTNVNGYSVYVLGPPLLLQKAPCAKAL